MTGHPQSGMQRWLVKRAEGWRRWQSRLGEGRGARDPEELADLVSGYRALARDVSVARDVLPGSRLTRFLDGLYHDLHLLLYRNEPPWQERLRRLYTQELPAAVAALRGELLTVTLLFLGAAVAGWLLIDSYPELAGLFASEDMISTVQQGKLWTDDLLNVVPSSVLSIGILTNNIMVSLTAFVLGAFYGLGTLYIIGMNGMMLGAIFAFVAQYGLDEGLFRFVLAHGVVELSVIVIAGAAGLRMGGALARPGDQSRAEAFRAAVHQAGLLLWVCVPFLVVCGFIEGYISPDPGYSMALRWAVGVGLWLLMVAVMTGWLFRGGVRLTESVDERGS